MPSSTPKIVCLVNATAGSAQGMETCGRLAASFRAHGAEALVVTATGADLTLHARLAVAQGADIVVAAGGDGTINAVAQALVGTNVALGVVPVGTLNHFAKDLKIPLDLDAAVATIARGATSRVDVGEVNGAIFLNNSSVGLYPWLVRQRQKLQRRGVGKWVALVRAVAAGAMRYSRLLVRLRIRELLEGERETPIVFVGNNKYEIAGARLGGRAKLDRGRLWVARAPRAGHLGLMIVALRAMLGLKPRELRTLEAKEIRIETASSRVGVATDGEVKILNSPLRYLSRPRALKVIVPQAA